MKPEFLGSVEALPSDVLRIDAHTSAAMELYFVEHPETDKRRLSPEELAVLPLSNIEGAWAYFKDRRIAIRVPNEDTFLKLRTARNRNLITESEQKLYRNARIGIAGLSVGSAVFATIVQTGGPKNIKIADPDIVEITNLNRMKATILDLGRNKVDVAAQAAWELDPYLDLEVWREGISVQSLGKFLLEPRLDVFVDEMDAIPLKIASRLRCKQARIPVVMATDNGDGVLLDVERFDLEPDRPIFHGRVHIDESSLATMDRAAFIQLANEIIDSRMFTPRQWESIQQIGKTLAGVPQLASAVAIAGAAVSYATRQILTKNDLPSGRYILGCEDAFKSKPA